MSRIAALLALLLVSCAGQPNFPGGVEQPSSDDSATTAKGGAEAEAPEAEGTPSDDLIPRQVLFGNPERASAKISPDGKYLSWLAPVDGVLNVWVAPVGDLENAKPVSSDSKRPIRSYFWAYDKKHLLYLQDAGGDENTHVFKVNVASSTTTDLTPIKGVKAQVSGVSHKRPNEIVVGLNNRNPQLHDLHLVDLKTGKMTLLQENPGFVGFILDDNYKVRLAQTMRPDGGADLAMPAKVKKVKKSKKSKKTETELKKNGPLGDVLADTKAPAKAKKSALPAGWELFTSIPADDLLTTNPIGLDKSGNGLYMLDSRGRNTAALVLHDLRGKKKPKVLAEHPKADASDIAIHPTSKKVIAVTFTHARREIQILDKSFKKDLDAIKKLSPGDTWVSSSTLNMKTAIVAAQNDDGPTKYYLYKRAGKKSTFLFTSRPALEGLPLTKMHPQPIESRDGLELVNYLSLPKGTDDDNDARPSSALPTVLLVHGGPWARDHWGYNSLHQLLANRGYAVLSVNYRGSTGFGKAFINAANKEWSKKMHDDLIDSVNWLVKENISQKDKICIMGGSYGGYATLVGLTMTPDVFACGVDIVGPSSIITLLKSVPPYWKPMIDLFKTRVGDWETEEGKAMLEKASPLNHVDKIKKPLLIGQGANDPRVKQAESDQIVKAMQQKGIPVSYVLFPDEGHGFAREPNRLAFFAAAEAFLSAHLGGKYQPTNDNELKGTTMKVPSGANGIPGFKALKLK
jgi:dipeptidyl aminopeptidase/acylaminoacyl peptidase